MNCEICHFVIGIVLILLILIVRRACVERQCNEKKQESANNQQNLLPSKVMENVAFCVVNFKDLLTAKLINYCIRVVNIENI